MKFFFLRRVASTRLFCWLLALPLLGAAPLWAQARDTAAPANRDTATPPAPDDDGTADAKAPARFGIALDTIEALKPMLLRHMELQRFRQLSDLDANELERLLAAAPDNLRDLLGTQGYFEPVITVKWAPAAPGDAAAPVVDEAVATMAPIPTVVVAATALPAASPTTAPGSRPCAA